MTILMTVEVAFLSYFIFKEKISSPQIVGILLVLIAVAMLSMCAPKSEGADEKASASGMFWVCFWAFMVTAVSCVCIECNNWLSIKRGVPGDLTGTFY